MKKHLPLFIIILFVFCVLVLPQKATADTAGKKNAASPISSVELKKSSMVYTGTPRTQTGGIVVRSVVDGLETVLRKGKDYTVSYSNNIGIGTAEVTVTGKGKYCGTITKTFRIIPRGTKITSLSSTTRRINVKWEPVCEECSGVQIQYSTSRRFTGNVWKKTVKKPGVTSRTLTGLEAPRTYHVRIRTYAVSDGKKYYSFWSKQSSIRLEANSLTVKGRSDGIRKLILNNAAEFRSEISFHVWSSRKSKDDLVVYPAEKNSAGQWIALFNVSNHLNDGKFYISVYSGNKLLAEGTMYVSPAETETEYSRLAASLNIARSQNQLILVAAEGTFCTLTMLNKNTDGTWHQIFSTDGEVGENGIGEVTEWNRRTPVGVYGFCQAFGILEDPGTAFDYIQVDDSWYWVDDPDSSYYNRFVSTHDTPISWKSAEHIIDYPICYRYCLALDYNIEGVPGAGSAIFLHIGDGTPTLGCIAVPFEEMEKIMKCVTKSCRIVIDTPEGLYNY